MDQGLLADVNAAIRTYRRSFYFWSVVFYTLCTRMIVLPIVVGVGTEALGTRWGGGSGHGQRHLRRYHDMGRT